MIIFWLFISAFLLVWAMGLTTITVNETNKTTKYVLQLLAIGITMLAIWLVVGVL